MHGRWVADEHPMPPKLMWWWGWGHRSPAQHWVASGIPRDAEDAGVTAAIAGSVDPLTYHRGLLSYVGLSDERENGSKNSNASFKVPDRAA